MKATGTIKFSPVKINCSSRMLPTPGLPIEGSPQPAKTRARNSAKEIRRYIERHVGAKLYQGNEDDLYDIICRHFH